MHFLTKQITCRHDAQVIVPILFGADGNRHRIGGHPCANLGQLVLFPIQPVYLPEPEPQQNRDPADAKNQRPNHAHHHVSMFSKYLNSGAAAINHPE
jgi:hypothetical protein